MHGCFALPLGAGFVYDAKLRAVMHVITVA